MKVFYNIIIILFVVLSLWIIKDDAISIYNKARTYIQDNISTIENLPKRIFFKDQEVVDGSRVEYELSGEDNGDTTSTASPGALRVLNKFVSQDPSSINLTLEKAIEITNKKRKESGLPMLMMNSRLNLSAEDKVNDMFKGQYFEHVSPSGLSVSDLANNKSYEYILIGENLAMGNFKDEQSLIDAWMTSPGHRANILNSHYTEIGISVKKDTFEGKTVWMAVQHFGLPKDICPSIDGALEGLIKIEQEAVKDTEEDLTKRRAMINSGSLYKGKTKNEQVDIYNELVVKYNEMIPLLKEKIDKYNKQVNAFNSCVENALK